MSEFNVEKDIFVRSIQKFVFSNRKGNVEDKAKTAIQAKRIAIKYVKCYLETKQV